MIIQMKDGDCERCDGCGYVANTDDAEPWTCWANLPLKGATAVTMGLVGPVECPECKGRGEMQVGKDFGVMPTEKQADETVSPSALQSNISREAGR